MSTYIIGEFEWVNVTVICWGDITTGYKRNYVRLRIGSQFYFGHIVWGERLEYFIQDSGMVWCLPNEVKDSGNLIELLLLIESLKVLQTKVNIKLCFAYKNTFNVFKSGLSDVYWIRDYLKVSFWHSVLNNVEVNSIYVSCNSS